MQGSTWAGGGRFRVSMDHGNEQMQEARPSLDCDSPPSSWKDLMGPPAYLGPHAPIQYQQAPGASRVMWASTIATWGPLREHRDVSPD